MKYFKMSLWCGLLAILAVALMPAGLWAQGVYGMSAQQIGAHKKFMDDPTAMYTALPMSKVVPADIYSKYVYDVEEMKKIWSEIVQFKAPDEVGKIAPEITPGTYSCQDKDKLPFKDLMIDMHYARFAAGDKPFLGNYPEIKVVATRQYYYAKPIGEATLKHLGETKLDDQGYLVYDSYTAGFPFGRPSGEFKAREIVYNWEKRYVNGESFYLLTWVQGFNDQQKMDFDSLMEMNYLNKLEGRVMMEPLGWFDARAEKNQEMRATFNRAYAPRDMFGNAFAYLMYSVPTKPDQPLIYLNMMRRVRKMSGTDTQDPMGGQDYIYDDGDGFNQKLSPDRYPYKMEVIEEREFLVPSYTQDGSGYLSSTGLELKDYEFERRPCYVVKLTQLDPHYIYSYRLMWVDKETFLLLAIQNYDQKGRLYRDMTVRYYFNAEMGMPYTYDLVARDNVDQHSMLQRFYIVPAPFLNRDHVGINQMIRAK